MFFLPCVLQAPVINDPWSGTFDAFDFGSDCLQHISGDIFDGSEDCLYLNLFVPINSTSINSNAKLAVVFYIYGGRFMSGASSDYAPDFLMEENVIVVCVWFGRLDGFEYSIYNISRLHPIIEWVRLAF